MPAVEESLLWVALLASAAGYVFYGLAMRRHPVGPSRASWLIWSVNTLLEVFSYQAVNQSAAQNLFFVLSAVCCVLTTISVWRSGSWTPLSRTEWVTLGACGTAVVAWMVFEDAWWGHVVLLAAVPASFVPTWVLVYRARGTVESSPAWGLWSIADLLVVIAISCSVSDPSRELPYAILELACNTATWLLVGVASIDPRRTFRILKGCGLCLITQDQISARQFLIGRDRKGKAIHAGQRFAKGQEVVRFHGAIYDGRALPSVLTPATDRFLQIDRDRFIGPSGDVDDLVNHSCDPSGGVRSAGASASVIALREIEVGEEVTIDYSTTTLDAAWSMRCLCGSAGCRGTVTDFTRLSDAVRRHYRDLDALPTFVLDTTSADAPRREHARGVTPAGVAFTASASRRSAG